MKVLFLSVALCLTALTAYNQATKKLQTVAWTALPVPSNCNSALKDNYYFDFEKSICYLQDSSALIPTDFEEEKQYGVIKINHLGKVQWQIMLQGNPEWVAKKNGNAIVFYFVGKKEKELHAVTINLKTHRTLNDKIIFTQADLRVDYIFENTPDGEFDHLITRTSGRKTNAVISGMDVQDKRLATTKLELIYLNETNEPSVTNITHLLNGGFFIASVTTKQKNFILTVLNKDNISFKLYKPGAVFEKELSLPIHYRNELDFFPYCTIDTLNEDNVMLMAYAHKRENKDWVMNIASVNFTLGKAIVSEEQVLDKKYAQDIKEEFNKNNPGAAAKKIDIPEYMKPTAILTNKDNICVIKQIRTIMPGSKNSIQYIDYPVVISCFDRNLKLQNNTIVDRWLSTFTGTGRPIGQYLKGDTLYVVASNTIGMGKLGAFVAKTNITNGKVSRYEIDRGNFLENSLLEGGATLWFRNAFIVSAFINVSSFINPTYNTALTKIEY